MTTQPTTRSSRSRVAPTEAEAEADSGAESHVVKLKHRPALDGLRGYAVAACLLYQTFTWILTGAWIGVDMFLVLSGFFIASMLLREERTWGSIDYLTFLSRRARRLLPTQFFMLAVVVVLGFFYIVPARRPSLGADVVASAFQFVNWRFIFSDQSYFANLSMPTPLRHMWSLNVQEQFYFVFPFVVMGLFALTRRRSVHVAALAGLAALSIWRMATVYVPGTDPSRVYYGTDTRIFEVIIGVIAAYLISERSFAMGSGRRHRGWLDRWDRQVGWAGLLSMAILTVLMFTVSEYSTFVFRGGLVAVCLLTLVAIVAASGPTTNVLQRVLSWRPLQRVGVMGYSLYIWHWPALVFSLAAFTAFPVWMRHVLAMALTVLVGGWAYKHIEEPAHRRGLKALVPGRPVLRKVLIVGMLPALLLGAWGLTRSTRPVASFGGSSDITLETPQYTPRSAPRKIVILGNSVAHSVVVDRGDSTPDLAVDIVARFGCDPFDRELVRGDRTIPPTEECRQYQKTWQSNVKADEKPFVVYFLPINLLADYRISGRTITPGSAEYDALVRSVLDEVLKKSRDNGATGFALNNLACHERPDFGGDSSITRSNDTTAVRHLNDVAAQWASASGVTVFDTYSALCPDDQVHATINGTGLYGDTLHFTPTSAPIYWRWLAPQIRAAAEK
ncbi:hypothetical protein JNB_03730 [Janibacter sp. HTCC2649]|uniref:acyltransferase family protein n=1 Tax=Janibacter sp. HTCC2649 TaxID=313589 RepID=UPI000066E9A8|nr:acyltransferase family protein [Janibacter sp. HTCC2649]EAP99248.1 hypothetical protein JNB_03730 [Janibacter sp. HTCC2649]